MIDKRLHQDWEAAAYEKAAELLATYPQIDALEAWIEGWWVCWENACPATRDESWPDEAVQALRSSRPVDDETSRAVEARILQGRGHSSPGTGSMIVARVLGRLAGSGPISLSRFQWIGQGLNLWEATFFEKFARAIAPPDRERWISELADFPATIRDCSRGNWGERESQAVPALEEEHARQVAAGEKCKLWGTREPRDVMPATSVIMRLRALFVLSPAAATAAFERVPSASLRLLYTIFLSLNDDADALLGAVEAAPLLWAGGKWTGNGVAPLFIEALTQHASKIAFTFDRRFADGSAQLAKEFYEKELPEYFRRATRAVLAREDGRWLAIDYATELLRRTSWSRRQDDPETRVKRVFLDQLIEGLHSAAVSTSEVQKFARRRLPASGEWSRRGEYLSVAGFLVNSETTAQSIWAQVTSILVCADDDDFSGTLDSYLMETRLFQGLARALAETRSPSESWLGTWKELYPRRERSRFAAVPVTGLRSSAYLAMVGLSVLQRLIEKREQEARYLWHVVAKGLRQLTASAHTRGLGLQFHQLAALPWAFAPHVDAAAWPTWISEWKDVFIVDPVAGMLAADFLIQNGVSRTTTLGTMKAAGCDPLAAGQELCDWLEAKGFGTDVDDVDVALMLAGVRAEQAEN